MDEINDMLEYPKLYLIDYFDTIKAKIDIEFELKTQNIQDKKLKEETIKKWIKLIKLTEECFSKCLSNKIPIEIIIKTKKRISILESSKSDKTILNIEFLKIKSELENYLLSNDSYLVVLIETVYTKYFGSTKLQNYNHIPNLPRLLHKRDFEKIILAEEGFTPIEIKYLKENKKFELINKEFDNPDFNFIKMKLILDEIPNKIQNIIYIEPFRKLTDLKLVFNEFYKVEYNYVAGNYKLKSNYFKKFTNLSNLSLFWVKLEKNSFVNLVNLTSLTFYRTDTHITDGMFNGLNNLITLNLSNNLNLILDNSCFSSLSNLKNLILCNCRLKILERNTFYGLGNLETLDLRDNNYKRLITDPNWENRLGFETNFFSIFPKLKRLDMSKSRVCQIKKDTFNELSQLEYLNLSDCRTKWEDLMETGCFNGLQNLKYLSLKSCGLDELEKDAFINLTSLETLDLSFNKNVSFKSGCFNGLINLKVLNLKECNLNKFKKGVFSCLINLEKIVVNSNSKLKFKFRYFERLKRVHVAESFSFRLKNDTFNGCDYLEELELKSVRFIKIESDCFSKLNNLKVLILIGCDLKMLNKNSLNGLKNLEKLDLSFNRELTLEDGCLDTLLKLEELNLSKCNQYLVKQNSSSKLNCLSSTIIITDAEMVYKLDMLNRLIHLQRLNLSFCKLKILTKNVFANLINLESLELNCNTDILFELGCFNGLVALKQLFISQCNIQNLHKEIFKELINVELLDLSNNQKINLESECLYNFSKLKKLLLIDCNLNENNLIMLSGLESLEYLYLDRNSLKELDMNSFENLKNLRILSLKNTRLYTLKRNNFIGLENLESIFLSDTVSIDFK